MGVSDIGGISRFSKLGRSYVEYAYGDVAMTSIGRCFAYTGRTADHGEGWITRCHRRYLGR